MDNSRRTHHLMTTSESHLAVAVVIVVRSLLGIEVRADTAFVSEIGLLGKSNDSSPLELKTIYF